MNPSEQISYKNILSIAVPMMIMGLSMTVVNLTDTAFLGQLGPVELGGAGNAGLTYMLLIMVGMGFSSGVQIIIARRNGEKLYLSIGTLVHHTLLFMLLYGVLLQLFLINGLPTVLPFITESDAVASIIERFLNYRSWGLYFNFINVTIMALLVGTANTKILGIVTPIAAVLNIVLDYTLIFGNWGFPALGVEGAAIASNIAEGASSVLLVLYLIFSYPHQKYELFSKLKIQLSVYQNILKTASPLMIQNFVSFFSWFAFFMLIEGLGERELAASHISRSIYMVLIIPVFGLGDADNSLTGNLMGENRSDLVLKMVGRVCLLSIGFAVLFQPIIWFGGMHLLTPFSSDTETLNLALPVLQVIAFVLFVFGVVIVGFRAVSGTGRTLTALFIEVVVVSFYLMVTYYLTTKSGIELYEVWYAEFAYFIAFGLLIFGYLWKGDWQSSKV